MPVIRLLSETDLRAVVPLDLAAIEVVENAFRSLAGGRVVMPPILSMEIADAHGEVDVKTAYVPGLPSFAIKVSPGFFDNPKIGLPSTSGLMILFSATTGQVEALLLDNGYLTDVRTAAAGAVAARALAREDAETACILGSGMQARMQLRALSLVRKLTSATIWGRNAESAEAAAREMSETLGIPVSAATDAEVAVRRADIVVTTTPATRPILMADWLKPGQHVTAMGSDQPGKCEIDPAALAEVRYVADRLSQTRTQGELRAAIAAGAVPGTTQFPELGAVLTGKAPGRRAAEDITLADLTGTGVQDTAIATHARAQAETAGRGTEFES